MQHDWIPSTLGHGTLMCRCCFVTILEAQAVGMTECDPPPPKAANTNIEQSHIDDHLYEPPDDDNEYDGDSDDDWMDECGLMDDGQCAMAGTEHCDFSCPNRDSEDFAGSAAWHKKQGANQ